MSEVFHIGMGSIEFHIQGLDVKIYKPCTSAYTHDPDRVLFCNHTEDKTYSFNESDLIASEERVDKYIVDATYKGKSMNEEILKLMKSSWIFTHESIVGGSIIIGQDNIGKVINLLYNSSDWLVNIVKHIEQDIKSKYNLSDEQYRTITEDIRGVQKITQGD